MKASDLYAQLEKDFVRPGMTENWYNDMQALDAFLCDNYKTRSMGLLCDFAEEITKVYTAVFPSDAVLSRVLADGTTDAMLFLHHPMDWEIGREPDRVFFDMNAELLAQLRKRRVSLFNFHYPLDNFGAYSTSKTLADALGITIEKPFAAMCGALCGVIGITDCTDAYALNALYAQAVGHETKLSLYGDSKIENGRVGICAGGGNDMTVLRVLLTNDVRVLISGLSVNNPYSADVHEFESSHGINLLGGTHYSSEKFACIALCDYFAALDLLAEFIPDAPCLRDM